MSTKLCAPSETKDVNIKIFKMITRINQTKLLVKHILCDCKCKLNNTTSDSNQNGIMININVSVNSIISVK